MIKYIYIYYVSVVSSFYSYGQLDHVEKFYIINLQKKPVKCRRVRIHYHAKDEETFKHASNFICSTNPDIMDEVSIYGPPEGYSGKSIKCDSLPKNRFIILRSEYDAAPHVEKLYQNLKLEK